MPRTDHRDRLVAPAVERDAAAVVTRGPGRGRALPSGGHCLQSPGLGPVFVGFSQSYATPSDFSITVRFGKAAGLPSFSERPGNVNSVTRPALRLSPARALKGALVVVLGAVLTVGVTASPAAAMELDTASPSPSSTVSSPPGEVRLQMDEIVFLQDVSVDVTGPDGDATTGLMLVLGRDITQPLERDLPNGRYTVTWSIKRSLINEGGSGSFTFRVGPPAKSDPGPGESGGAVPPAAKTPNARATPSAAATPSTSPTRLSAPVATSGKRQQGGDPIAKPKPTVNVPEPDVAAVQTTSAEWLPPPVFWWALVVAVAVGVLTVRRRRNRPAPLPEAVPAVQMRQTELVLGAGAGLTSQDAPREALTPTMGVPRVPTPAAATPAAGVERQTLSELFTPYTADRREHASSQRGS
jgi:methionine-rich copper-binding protein CopC